MSTSFTQPASDVTIGPISENGIGPIIIDGHDMSDHVHDVTVSITAGHTPHINLTLAAPLKTMSLDGKTLEWLGANDIPLEVLTDIIKSLPNEKIAELVQTMVLHLTGS